VVVVVVVVTIKFVNKLEAIQWGCSVQVCKRAVQKFLFGFILIVELNIITDNKIIHSSLQFLRFHYF